MDETLISRLADEVLRRMEQKPPLPRAYCIGTPPNGAPFTPVAQAPYDMVVLCTLSPAELLSMPTDPVCRALLEGRPVYLMEEGLEHRQFPAANARMLMAELMAKERHLRTLGIRLWDKDHSRKLYTAQDVRQLGRQNIPPHARLTPLARDFMEGKQ